MEEEFVRLYTGIYRDLYKFALYTLCNEADAEDAVSEAVVDGFAGFHKLRDKGAFKSWMFTILSAKCKRRLKAYALKDAELPAQQEEGEDDWDGKVPDSLISQPVDVAEKLDLWNAFDRLEERERLILNLSVIAGYEGREIAAELSMNHNTVRTIRKRALDKMRAMLE